MSWFNEDGNYSHKTKTNAEAGVICDNCMTSIAECEDGKLYHYCGNWICKSCLISTIVEDLDQIGADDTYEE